MVVLLLGELVLVDLINLLFEYEGIWGFLIIIEIIFNGVFYVLFFKSDKFGCMVDWIDNKDGRDGCGGRQ